MSVTTASNRRFTLRDIQAQFTSGGKLTMLTAYDAVTAALLDQAGVEVLLVGDSLGNVVLGYDTTIPVTLEDMIRHTGAVVRGSKRAMIICDLPFGVTATIDDTVRASIRIFQETGCQGVKLEGGLHRVPTVRRLTEEGIPVVAHIGLTPQSVHQLGGYYRHGKTDSEAARLREAALALQDAGAFCVVLECVMPEVAAQITQELRIPTVGIGSGEACAGQVLVINDLIGHSVNPAPKFAQKYRDPQIDVGNAIRRAAGGFVQDVKAVKEVKGTQKTPHDEALART